RLETENRNNFRSGGPGDKHVSVFKSRREQKTVRREIHIVHGTIDWDGRQQLLCVDPDKPDASRIPFRYDFTVGRPYKSGRNIGWTWERDVAAFECSNNFRLELCWRVFCE